MPLVLPTVVPPLPVPPTTSDSANFDARADAFFAQLQAGFRSGVNDLAANVYSNAQQAHAEAQLAAGSAVAAANSVLAAVNAPGTSGTSASSMAVGTGARSCNTQPGKAWVVGQNVVVARTADPAGAAMAAVVTAYDPATGAMAVQVSQAVGAGTFTDWTISAGTVHGMRGNLQANPADTSPGSLLTVGAFGLGGLAIDRSGGSFDTVPAVTHFWRGSGMGNSPGNIAGWWMVHQMVHDATYIVQMATQFSGAAVGRTFSRVKAGTWGAWVEITNSSNVNTAAANAFSNVNTFAAGARLGSTSPVLRTFTLSGTMPSAANSFVAIPHGLGTGALDIISVSGRVAYLKSGHYYNWVAPGLRAYQLGYGITWDLNYVNVATLEAGQSENVYGRAVSVLVTLAT